MTHNAEQAVLPRELDEIDALFLTAALSKRYPGTQVADVTIGDLRQGSASSMRMQIDFGDNPHDLPQSMFMKGDFVDHDFTSAAAFAGEVRYFQHIAASLTDAVRQPVAYFAGVDERGQAIVILEDLALRGVQFGDCEHTLGVDAVADGVRQLGAAQGRFWNGHGLEQFDWLADISAVASLMKLLVQPEHFDDYINRDRASFLRTPLRDRQRIESALQAMFDSDVMLPTAFVHGDAHLGNTFRDPTGKLGFCDFQAMGRGPYIWDVTYFMTGAMDPEDRSTSERDLLSLYLDELRRRRRRSPKPRRRVPRSPPPHDARLPQHPHAGGDATRPVRRVDGSPLRCGHGGVGHIRQLPLMGGTC